MICPKCGMYNTYGKQECTQCGHSFLPKPVELSEDETAAAQERESAPYYYTAKPDPDEDEPKKFRLLPEAPPEFLVKTGSFFRNTAIFFAYMWAVLKKHRRVLRFLAVVLALAVLVLAVKIISSVKSCIDEQEYLKALAASLADVVEIDPTPSVASMSDVWVQNQYGSRLTLNDDGTFTNDGFENEGSGTWTHDLDRIYLTYDDETHVSYSYKLIGDYIFLNWEEQTFTLDCNASESVAAAGLWINDSGYAMALNEDGTHGAASEEYGKYANTWVLEDGILAMVTIRNNVECFDYFGCQIDGTSMLRLSGSVFIREGGGISIGGGEIEFSSGYLESN